MKRIGSSWVKKKCKEQKLTDDNWVRCVLVLFMELMEF